MIKRVHCKHYNDFGHCKVLKKRFLGFLWKTGIVCTEYYGSHGSCVWAERSPKPPPPAPIPKTPKPPASK